MRISSGNNKKDKTLRMQGFFVLFHLKRWNWLFTWFVVFQDCFTV